MSVRRLRTFIAIAEHGSLSAAAEALFLTVPAVSMQLRQLEEELRTPLVDRASKPPRLNAAGDALLLKAREIVYLYDQLPDAVSEARDVAGTLTLGAIPTALSSVIPRALKAMAAAHPRLQIRVVHGLSPAFAEQLHHGDMDAAIVSEPAQLPETLRWRAFATEPVMVIAPPEAPGDTDADVLRALPYIRFNRRFWVSRVIEDHLRARGLALREVMELDSLEAIFLMVHHGLGASIVPVSDAGLEWLPAVRQLPFGEPPMTRTIGLAERGENPKARITGALFAELEAAARLAAARRPGRT
jgi:DNA-binding transcriptional LysR family regulator